ncbi:hypothetical protein Taro_010706, partial [Colocasia esculenta]|nr:hypothetical protein [Colocasia esculenta]
KCCVQAFITVQSHLMETGEDIEGGSMLKRTMPLGPIDQKRARFPCCIVWTPLPFISWLIPFIGHIGICREDGVILDFAGSNFVCVDHFTFGAVARYIQLDRKKVTYLSIPCCQQCKKDVVCHSAKPICVLVFSCRKSVHSKTILSHHEFAHGMHSLYMKTVATQESHGQIISPEESSWDAALRKSIQEFQHRSYNLFTCNCHSFVANNLNRLCYGGHDNWNAVNLAAWIFVKGTWVNRSAIVKSFLPFLVVFGVGILLVGSFFVTGLLLFTLALVSWFLLGTYCCKNLIQS